LEANRLELVTSISRTVREIVEDDLSLQDALQRGYANMSAVARLIKPKVEEKLEGVVNIAGIITSVKRTKGQYGPLPSLIKKVAAESVVNVRTDVAKLSIEKTKRALETTRRILANYQDEFLQLSESISAITLIFDEKVFDEIKSIFKKEDILEETLNLAAIIVHSPKEIIKTPGCAITFYNQVSRRRINIEDTVSCYTDTIVVVQMQDVGRAFTALTELISEARKVEKKGAQHRNKWGSK